MDELPHVLEKTEYLPPEASVRSESGIDFSTIHPDCVKPDSDFLGKKII